MAVSPVAICQDGPDLRDRIYASTLRPLPPRLRPFADLPPSKPRFPPLDWLPRDQGEEGSCASQAVAALIDLQNVARSNSPKPIEPVSARMLAAMARQQAISKSEGVSLRDVIKGFYHNGVCSNRLWPYEPGREAGDLDVARSKEARCTSLGSYSRLLPVLNDYHSAIAEVGPIVVSAGIHGGWDGDLVRQAGGRITPSSEETEKHAFIVIGYDDSGFIVLNSWGQEWGGFEGCSGVAHWTYEDWADNIMDGWVLRLGVPAPAAFPLTIGEQGIYFAAGSPSVGSTPARNVTGHLIHLDDGHLSSAAPYPTSISSIDETMRYLRRDGSRGLPTAPRADGSPAGAGYRGVLLQIAGSMAGLGDVAKRVSQEKRLAKQNGLYLLTVAWCNDAFEQTETVLAQICQEAARQIPLPGPDLDDLIEAQLHFVGRAFWREVERAAASGGAADGPLLHVFRQLADLPDYSLHLVSDGAGILLLKECLAAFRSDYPEYTARLLSRLRTVDFITPTIDSDGFTQSFQSLFSKGGQRPAVTVHVPSSATESRLRVGSYSRSALELIENSFWARHAGRPNFIGKSDAAVIARDALALRGVANWSCRRAIEINDGTADPLSQREMQQRSKLMESILKATV